MDAFNGSWKFVKSENIDEYLAARGFGEELRNVINVIRPVYTFSNDGKSLVVRAKTVFSNKENKFQLGEEFEEETVPGCVCKSTITLEDEKLIQVRKDADKDVLIIREIQDGKLITTYTHSDVTAVEIYEKV